MWAAELTGCPGRCGGRRRAGSPPGSRRSGLRRSRGRTARTARPGCCAGSSDWTKKSFYLSRGSISQARGPRLDLPTEQMPVSGWQESECPLHSHSSQWPRYRPPPVRVYPGAQSLKRNRHFHHDEGNQPRPEGGAEPAYLAGKSLVPWGASALLHLQCLGQAAVVGHRHLHADVRNAGGAHLGGVGRSNQDVVQIRQNHHQVLAGGGHAVRTAPVFLRDQGQVSAVSVNEGPR